jgi:hypothetical protein
MGENEVKAQPATMSGQAQRIPAALKAQNAVMHATIHVTRKATGLTETYQIVGTPLATETEPKEGT